MQSPNEKKQKKTLESVQVPYKREMFETAVTITMTKKKKKESGQEVQHMTRGMPITKTCSKGLWFSAKLFRADTLDRFQAETYRQLRRLFPGEVNFRSV